MRTLVLIGKASLVVALLAVTGVGVSSAIAKPPVRGGGGGGCNCPDVYAPVICSNGVVYSNGCQASCARATGCVPYGDDI